MPIKNGTRAAEVRAIMLAVSGASVCGLVGVVAGSLMAVFTKPLARSITEKGGVDLEARLRHFESLLRRGGMAMIFMGAMILVTTMPTP